MTTKMHPHSKPDKKEIRDFGLMFGAFTGVLFGGFFPWVWEYTYPTWPWYVLAASAGIALTVPLVLTPFYRLWMAVGQVLGWINTRLVLGLIFFAVFTPYSLILKLLGKDLLSRKLDKELESYRVKTNPKASDNMEKPF